MRATELAVVDDPTIKQRNVEYKAGSYAGTCKYDDAANLPPKAKGPKRGAASGSRAHKHGVG